MRIGLQIPSFTWPGGGQELRTRLADIARTAEDAGFSSIWVMDHFFQIEMVGAAEQEMLEGYSALSYLAALTRRVQLGTLVTGVTYRHPGVLAKTVSTLDVLSGGRAVLGIGAAWYEREHRGLGVPYPPIAQRFEHLEEALQIIKQMWSDDVAPWSGRHYQLEETLNVPQPIQKPHPPILIGGQGERKTLRLVAQYGDACNLFTYGGIDNIRHKLDVLRRHCDTIGRPFDEIERTSLSTVNLAPEQQTVGDVIRHCRELAEAGIEQAIVNMFNVHEIAPLEIFGKEIIPEVAGL